MSHLRTLHELLKREYAQSQHIFWIDEATSTPVNDIYYTLNLIFKTAKCLRQGEHDCWGTLVKYCLDRAMSPELLQAISNYLQTCGKFDPLPLMDGRPEATLNSQIRECPLLEEENGAVDRVHLHAKIGCPEPDRMLAFKGDHKWSQYPWRLREECPIPPRKLNHMIQHNHHWLY